MTYRKNTNELMPTVALLMPESAFHSESACWSNNLPPSLPIRLVSFVGHFHSLYPTENRSWYERRTSILNSNIHLHFSMHARTRGKANKKLTEAIMETVSSTFMPCNGAWHWRRGKTRPLGTCPRLSIGYFADFCRHNGKFGKNTLLEVL